MADMCDDNRFELIEKYKRKLIEATNIETAKDEMAVLNDILFRFWQMGWLESIDRMQLVKESTKTLMNSGGDSASCIAFRNAGRFIQNAIDGEAPDFEKVSNIEPEQRWIPVSETVDVPKHEVLACDKYGTELIGFLYEKDKQWMCESDECFMYDVVAWMPLPEPYKGDTE